MCIRDRNDLLKDDDDKDKEMQLICKNIQTDRMLDMIIKNTSPIPTVSQQTGIPTVAQQAHMHDLRKTGERKATKRFAPSAYDT